MIEIQATIKTKDTLGDKNAQVKVYGAYTDSTFSTLLNVDTLIASFDRSDKDYDTIKLDVVIDTDPETFRSIYNQQFNFLAVQYKANGKEDECNYSNFNIDFIAEIE